MALAVVWEFGPVGAGLLAAGRLGAGLGAELGALKESEQKLNGYCRQHGAQPVMQAVETLFAPGK